ncbi:MAG TPA: hypothetical protein VK826_09415 [Bacteroidia bacterium]|nr:hypothetical protein [Bacteroidia bacterium]
MKKMYTGSFLRSRWSMLLVPLLFGAVFTGCRDDEAETDIGYGYFPTQVGHWVVYEVDSTVYDDFEGDTDVYRYQIKELLESSFTDNEGRPAIRVERYKRWYDPNLSYDSIPWYLSRVWAFTRTTNSAEKLEENERFIRLSFPVTHGRAWDGNAFNTIGRWTYTFRAADESYTINSIACDSTALVEQKKEINGLTHRVYTERYAKNIGMIEKNVIDVSDDNIGPVGTVPTRIHSGVIYNIRMVDYGPR